MNKTNFQGAVLIALILLILPLGGCLAQTRADDPFSVFNGDFSASFSIEINGSDPSGRYEKKGDKETLALSSPSLLSGFTFTFTEERITLKTGDTEISADGQVGFLPRLLHSVVSQDKDGITEITSEKAEVGTVTVIKTAAVTYRFDKDGTPISAFGTVNGVEFRLTFTDFSSLESKGANG